MMTGMNSGLELRGSMTALVTPFRDGEVDWPCLDKLVDRQIEGGTDWLVPLGTTGESPTLTRLEREKLLEAVIARAAGRRPVLAGVGTNSTAETVARAKRAAAAGANAAMVVAPCYNRPTAEGLFRHFAKVAESVELPLVLYNVPGRTGVNIENELVVRLRERFPNIVAIKDATGTVSNVTELQARCDILVLCGDDQLTWPFMALGAAGVVSVLANLVPSLMKSLVKAALEGDTVTALQLHRKVYDLAVGIGRFGPNPLPIKTALSLMRLIADEYRLPLCPLDDPARERIACVLRRHEIPEASPV